MYVGKHAKQTKKHLKKGRVRWYTVLLALVLAAALLWALFVFSPTPLITKWREIWVETAMTTFTHKWLATYFIPAPIIDGIMERANEQYLNNLTAESELPPAPSETVIPVSGTPSGTGTTANPALTNPSAADPEPDMDPEKLAFLTRFYELDASTLPADFDTWDYDSVILTDAEKEGIKTLQGDTVWGIDAKNGILIVVVEGEGYKGKLAIVKDSSQVIMAANRYTDRGETVGEFLRDTGGILGINANAFRDDEGKGRGHLAVGLIIASGVKKNDRVGGVYQSCGYDYDDNFRVGYAIKIDELRDAGEFMPIVVLNGDSAVDGSFGMGLQPRTVIGQTAAKETLMLVIDGRQIGHSLGATMADCAEILLRYNCYNALGMDGGSSSSMVYDGEIITSPSTPMPTGRYLPCAWIVLPAGEKEPA